MASMLQAIIDDPTPGPSVGADRSRLRAAGPALAGDLRAELEREARRRTTTRYGGWGDVQKFMDWDAVEYCCRDAAGGDAAAEAHGPPARSTPATQADRPGVGRRLPVLDRRRLGPPALRKDHADPGREPAHLRAAPTPPGTTRRTSRRPVTSTGSWHLPPLAPTGAFYTSQDADLVQGEHAAILRAGRRRPAQAGRAAGRPARVRARERVGDQRPGSALRRDRRRRGAGRSAGGGRVGPGQPRRWTAAASATTSTTPPGLTWATRWRWAGRCSALYAVTGDRGVAGEGRRGGGVYRGPFHGRRIQRRRHGRPAPRRRVAARGRSWTRTWPPPGSATCSSTTPAGRSTASGWRRWR